MKTFLATFTAEIQHRELPLFRGAIINMPLVSDILFHNHVGEGFRYSYPLIQYKRIGGKAAILFIGEGTDKIEELLSQNLNDSIQIGKRTEPLKLANVEARTTRTQIWDDSFHYTIRKYLSLNKHNYELYTHTEEMSERLHILEQNLIGNILSFAKGVGLHVDGQIEVKITQMFTATTYTYKGVKMAGFDLEFKTNISLPDYIGLGKGVSIGFGMIKRMTK